MFRYPRHPSSWTEEGELVGAAPAPHALTPRPRRRGGLLFVVDRDVADPRFSGGVGLDEGGGLAVF